ncbi:helix-turn-helix domain-containing protein [Catenulispora pinisilvae]|uniref:helix-turn-helix domain-containing protein n=1 Tax=Catenulispora pinisilvae TaxID=2705253 RepID=UPI00189205A0|nr:helix-turn-helix domain-containing protein [Catenulispora pinisilvae]
MRIHRSARVRFFTTLGNEVLRDSRLSFCARGILAYLLSQPDGKRDDIRTLAERTPEGRERVASAMRELERHGYLKRTKKRTSEGHIYTEVEVFDGPGGPSSQLSPETELPASGGPTTGPDGDQPVKDRGKEPTHPAPSAEDGEDGREGECDEETRASVELLARVARTEPQLSVGRADVVRLAPLVTEWRRRGASELHVVGSLTSGLPRAGVYHPARFIETRLIAKMPVERCAAPEQLECGGCGIPVPAAGLCRSCREARPTEVGAATEDHVLARGVAMARAALRGLSLDVGKPALA